jgi:hypothetical protein
MISLNTFVWDDGVWNSLVKCVSLFIFFVSFVISFSSERHIVLRFILQDHNIRPGWVTIGSQLTSTNWNKESYLSYFEGEGGHLLGTLPGTIINHFVSRFKLLLIFSFQLIDDILF